MLEAVSLANNENRSNASSMHTRSVPISEHFRTSSSNSKSQPT